jgi:hypothetical protein
MSRVRTAALLLGLLAATVTLVRAQIDCVGPVPRPCTLFKHRKAVFVGTVITKDRDSGRCRFRVTEAFKGVEKDHVDLVQNPVSAPYFDVGKQYLVFADACFREPQCLTSSPCSGSIDLKFAQAVVEQLRAQKNGKRIASLYGVLRDRGTSSWEDYEMYKPPMPGVVVRMRSGIKSFQTRTDEQGVYAFERLPAGKYEVSADLPPTWLIEALFGRTASFELPRHCCYEYDIFAVSTGWITGRVNGVPPLIPHPISSRVHSRGE